MRESERYRLECIKRGESIYEPFYKKLLEADLRREKQREEELNKLKHYEYRPPVISHNTSKYSAHPDSMDDVVATIFYIFIMIFGSIFNARIIIWITSTIIFIMFKNSHWHEEEK